MDFMMILTNILTFLEGLTTGDGLKYIGAGIAVFTGFAAALGEGSVAAHAVDAIARQPEMAGNIRITMLIGQAVSETTGLYSLLIAFLLMFAVR